ncbi:DUF1127 domain-containing protein [Bradyrhizobium nanningense]|uniref:DUF1127 domain-containing protein n=1 Tax=Bradyrhizobium nanningense TaxID=1325118 RepID=UPI001008ADD7|nr:DUF1127 domain-containing protein [Bradyrhizobium nanningense]
MSCDSTIASTDTSRAAFSPSPNLAWVWRLPLALLNGITRRRQYGELLELDDRLLADMGLSRTIVAEARKSASADWATLVDCSFSIDQARRTSPCEGGAPSSRRR